MFYINQKLFLIICCLALMAPDATVSEKCDPRFVCGKLTYDPPTCADHPNLHLSCDSSNRTVLFMGPNSDKYYVTDISSGISSFVPTPSYGSSVGITNFVSIRLLDPAIFLHQENSSNCSTVPFPLYSFHGGDYDTDLLVFLSCVIAINSPKYTEIDDSCCSSELRIMHRYVMFGKWGEVLASDIEDGCTIERSVRSTFPSLQDLIEKKQKLTFQHVYDAMAAGYELHWLTFLYGYVVVLTRKLLFPLTATIFLPKIAIRAALLLVLIITVRAIAGGIIILFAYLIYNRRPRHASIYDSIENFLQNGNNMVPIKYSFRHVQRMTNNFKEKLGQGGYGSVYKGKLQSGQFVAVKILSAKSKINGKEFINEVAALGRISHVNVVRLVGFCASATKNALIYEYMPNGSLDKCIFSQDSEEMMNWRKMHQIALGVARGMAYLHQGCNMQILHFDIKPHNILLDERFIPKISDFGLAKLRPVKNDAVTMTAVRGTLGYMAPELFYKRVGEVTCKADVYSFGMLLMEMAGRRRNVDVNAEHSSQIYFPSWVYDQFERDRGVEFGAYFSEGEEEEREIARKLILIAFWCIQMTPDDRPSMKDVLEMLQGDSESLLLPPKPCFHPPNQPVLAEERSCSSSSEELTESSCEYVSLEIQALEKFDTK